MSIEKFAIWARKELISRVEQRAYQYGITNRAGFGDADALSIDGKALSDTEPKQRRELINELKNKGYNQVMEEVAYTWFNRFIALRFMEVNNYLPSHIRVFTDINGKFNPEIIKEALNLDFESIDRNRVADLINDSNKEELYRYLLLVQCNELNKALPVMFERMDSYTSLLLPNNILSEDGIIGRMISDIPEEEWTNQVQVIGWLYQYYISEKHGEVVDPLHGKTIKKEDIPAATQLFTTDWVVRYMVDNSLGRYWIERHPESRLAKHLEFLITPKNGEIPTVDEKVRPQDLTFLDPCVGSGHILVYAFEVLMEIYRECGYEDRDAVEEIVKNNLYGTDIDDRAAQLAYFAIMMKARSYDRRFLSREIAPNVLAILESNLIKDSTLVSIKDPEQRQVGLYLKDRFLDAKEIGSLVSVDTKDYASFENYLITNTGATLDFITDKDVLLPLAKQAFILSKKYAVVCTNPPYMNKMEGNLKKFVTSEFKDYSSDLFSAFIYHNFYYCKADGYSSFMTPNVWMFIKSYEKLREYIIKNKSISSLIQIAKGAFYKEATVDVCCFVLQNVIKKQKGLFLRLEDFKGDMEVQKQKVLEAIANKNCGYFYESDIKNFSKIPGSPIAYWVSEPLINAFKKGVTLGQCGQTSKGLITGDNDFSLRLWWEKQIGKICFIASSADDSIVNDYEWFPLNKGGIYRKWYGNNEYIIHWINNGENLSIHAKTTGHHFQNYDSNLKFKPYISWSDITSGLPSFRYRNNDLSDHCGMSYFPKDGNIFLYLALLNTNTAARIFDFIAPTFHLNIGELEKLPRLISDDNTNICNFSKQNVEICKKDWDAFETSWDFEKHPLVRLKSRNLKNAFSLWMAECDQRFNQLKANEEELNRIFIDIYGLQGELTPDVADKDVTVRKSDLQRDVKSLISYAVGCMFGRYSLDEDGLAYAGGDWDISKYKTFVPDDDNIIPICDTEYFSDDIVGRFVEWVEKVYGSEDLEGNLAFIAGALGGQGASRDVIRKYFLNDFYADHCKIYQKRPIYWLFDSGKKNGFKALIYMHRYSRDLLARLRTDYVHEQQERYDTRMAHIEKEMEGASIAEASRLKREQTKLKDQAMELHKFEEKVHDLADRNIEIDLDDGVKNNYAIFADVLAKLK